MALKEQLQQDLQDAMRQRDAVRKAALRMVLSGIQLAEVESGPLDDAAVIRVIQQETRRREDALEMIRAGGREELVAEEQAQLEILHAYLPELLGADEITPLAASVIAEVGATSPADIGKVMGKLMPQLKGKADGRLVNQVVRELLAG